MANCEYVVMKQVGNDEAEIVSGVKHSDFWDADLELAREEDKLIEPIKVINKLQAENAIKEFERREATRFYIAGRPVSEWQETEGPL